MHIDFLGIQAFVAVAECGTFGLAAARLHLTQAAISHRMRKLEESLGVQLIVRTSRGISLTQAGEAMLPRARQSMVQLEESWALARRHGQQAPAWVSFACLPTVASGVLVDLLQQVQLAHPDVQVRVFDSSPSEILELVQARTVAFGISVGSVVAPDFASQTIAREPFVLACPKDHPLAALQSVDWAQLQEQRLIRISLPSGNSATIDDSLGPAREAPRWGLEVQRTAMALQMVRGGLGLTVVPALAVKADDGVACVPLRAPEVSRSLVLLTAPGVSLQAPERLMAETLSGLIRQRLGPV
ncbi:MAG: LysR family transcriptional regulator [Betaproteobacteria bacterium]